VSRCLVCGSGRSRPAPVAPLVECADCGLTRTPGAARPALKLYDDGYFDGGGYPAYFARASQWRFEARRRLRWLLAASRPRGVLEVGCAGGFFLEAARNAGLDAVGVEVSATAAASARGLGVPVVTGTFEEAEIEGPFDAVCAFHVLEHAEDPVGFLARARSVLAPRGPLALEVPNAGSASARRSGAAWPYWDPAHHRTHFTPRTLLRVLAEAGFLADRCDTVFARHYVRPRRLARRPSVAMLARDLLAARSPRTVHPDLGDHLRVLANARP
jgi:SAM-dependent methyltransferase